MDNAIAIAGQLMSLADEDDQLGRGEFYLVSVEADHDDQRNFLVTIETRDETPRIEYFRVKIEKI